MRTPTLRWIGYFGGIAGSVLFVLSCVVLDWICATPSKDEDKLRMQWHVIADAPIKKGTLIREKHLSRSLSRIKDSGEFITNTQDVIGKFASADLEKESPLKSEDFSYRLAFVAPSGGAVVSVKVASGAAVTICPGMRIAFVRRTPKKPGEAGEPKMLPSFETTEFACAETEKGFAVLSVSYPEQKEKHFMVTVAVPTIEEAIQLADFEWQAIVLGREE